MEKVIFRGLYRRKGEKRDWDGTPLPSIWKYGGIFPNNKCKKNTFAIIYQQEPVIDKFPVYADTVGMFTGLYDKRENMIFGGDIVKIPYAEADREYTLVEQVVYMDKSACFALMCTCEGEKFYRPFVQLDEHIRIKEIEVIGNIYDDPELLEE